MKQIQKLIARLRGLIDAIARYPLTSVFLVAAAIVNAIDINTGNDYSKYLLTLVVGAFLSAVTQMAYERYFNKFLSRIVLMAGAALLTLGYYLIIMPAPKLSMEVGIRTFIALFCLLIAFIWVPVIKSRITFNESFMATFKAFFISLFFSAVIFAGISIIIEAINQLLISVDSRAYSHTANIVFLIFAPIYFLSLIPVYPGASNQSGHEQESNLWEEQIDKATSCPKFLEILISYIIVPLVAVFTVILIIYIIINIGGKFWTNNLLEPMLVSYAITVIILYILASRLDNKFAAMFRMVFPKVLVPIVIFQIVSSVISLTNTGITHTRYFVILFGIFAACAGVLLSIIPVKKNGIIAGMVIVFALISIIPPVDAFTVSRVNQVNMLEKVLEKNGMLVNGVVTPNALISDTDKQTITKTVNYLSMMEYTSSIKWLPSDFNTYDNFYKTFGFYEYQQQPNVVQPIYLNVDQQISLDISKYDSFSHAYINIPDRSGDLKIRDIEKSGKSYALTKYFTDNKCDIKLIDSNNTELISFPTSEIFDKFSSYVATKGIISPQEATFTSENDSAIITVVTQNVSIDNTFQNPNYSAELYIFIKIK